MLLQDSKYSAEIVTSPSLDVFLPEDEDNPYESVTTAVTRKPCSLDINHRLNACPGNGREKSKAPPPTLPCRHDQCFVQIDGVLVCVCLLVSLKLVKVKSFESVMVGAED